MRWLFRPTSGGPNVLPWLKGGEMGLQYNSIKDNIKDGHYLACDNTAYCGQTSSPIRCLLIVYVNFWQYRFYCSFKHNMDNNWMHVNLSEAFGTRWFLFGFWQIKFRVYQYPYTTKIMWLFWRKGLRGRRGFRYYSSAVGKYLDLNQRSSLLSSSLWVSANTSLAVVLGGPLITCLFSSFWLGMRFSLPCGLAMLSHWKLSSIIL